MFGGYFTEQSYPRSSDPVAGIATDIIAATTNTFTVKVGPAGGAGTGAAVDAVVGAGGTLAFNITSAGSGYVNPRLNILIHRMKTFLLLVYPDLVSVQLQKLVKIFL